MAAARTASRSIGRPPRAGGVDARESLLDAAVMLFAEKGVAGTTSAEIAARSGVTPAMVHYYFTNRDRLLDAVAAERLQRIVSSVWAPVAASEEVVPLLRGLVRRIVKATEVHPWLPSVWLREVVSVGGQLRSRLFRVLPFGHVQHLISAVKAAQRRGQIDPGLEPRLVLMSVLGLTLLPLANLQLLHQVLPGVKREDVARHAEALLVSAFSRRPQRRAPAR